jgi:hypothetical protein
VDYAKAAQEADLYNPVPQVGIAEDNTRAHKPL